jgi:hypothetical protein
VKAHSSCRDRREAAQDRNVIDCLGLLGLFVFAIGMCRFSVGRGLEWDPRRCCESSHQAEQPRQQLRSHQLLLNLTLLLSSLRPTLLLPFFRTTPLLLSTPLATPYQIQNVANARCALEPLVHGAVCTMAVHQWSEHIQHLQQRRHRASVATASTHERNACCVCREKGELDTPKESLATLAPLATIASLAPLIDTLLSLLRVFILPLSECWIAHMAAGYSPFVPIVLVRFAFLFAAALPFGFPACWQCPAHPLQAQWQQQSCHSNRPSRAPNHRLPERTTPHKSCLCGDTQPMRLPIPCDPIATSATFTPASAGTCHYRSSACHAPLRVPAAEPKCHRVHCLLLLLLLLLLRLLLRMEMAQSRTCSKQNRSRRCRKSTASTALVLW